MTFGWPQLIMVMLMTARTVYFWATSTDWHERPIVNIVSPLLLFVPIAALLWWGGFF